MKTINDTQNFLSLAQAAKRLKISRIAVYKRVKSGSLKAFRVGRSYVVEQGSLTSDMDRSNRFKEIDLAGLHFNKGVALALRQAVWDYNVSPKELFEILQGRKSTFSFNQPKLIARLLTSVGWYTLVDIFGTHYLKEIITDDTLRYVWNDDAKKRLLYAREILNEQ